MGVKAFNKIVNIVVVKYKSSICNTGKKEIIKSFFRNFLCHYNAYESNEYMHSQIYLSWAFSITSKTLWKRQTAKYIAANNTFLKPLFRPAE